MEKKIMLNFLIICFPQNKAFHVEKWQKSSIFIPHINMFFFFSDGI